MKVSSIFGSGISKVNLDDRSGLQSALALLKGDAEGKYFDGSEHNTFPAQCTALHAEIEAYDRDFVRYQEQRVNAGKRKPEKWPEQLRKRKLLLEAALSVRMDEVAEIEKRLKEITEKVEVVEDKRILQFGPRGSGRLRNGVLCEMDGAKVIRVNGRLLFDNGPYRGMEICDYVDVVEQWKAAKRENDRRKLEALQKEDERYGRPVRK